jgi:hypothetical protein
VTAMAAAGVEWVRRRERSGTRSASASAGFGPFNIFYYTLYVLARSSSCHLADFFFF